MFQTPESVKARITAYVVPITATTAPVKSFDSLREGAAEARVTRNRNSNAPPIQAMMMRMLLSTLVGPSCCGITKLTPLRAVCDKNWAQSSHFSHPKAIDMESRGEGESWNPV